MTIPNATPISILSVKNEFGTNGDPLSLNEYYAGGAFVPAGTTGANGAVPSSGYISLWHFLGTSNYKDRQTMVAATLGPPYNTTGFIRSIGGSMTDGTFNPYGNVLIKQFEAASTYFGFVIDAQNVENGRWTSVEIVGWGSFNRVDAYTFFSDVSSTGWFFYNSNLFSPGVTYDIIFR